MRHPNGHPLSRPETTPYDRLLVVWLPVTVIAVILFVALVLTGSPASATLCDDSSCTSTVPETTDPATTAPSTTVPQSTTTVVPSTSTQPPPPSSTVDVAPPPTLPTTTAQPTPSTLAPCDTSDGYPRIHDDTGACQIDPCLANDRQYAWYYTAPPVDTPAWQGTTVGFVFDCWVPIPQQLPVTGAGRVTAVGVFVGVLAVFVGGVLLALSRRREGES